jgi:hypothetical protein
MTNKAAYRRFTMERLAILNDTISEFTRYVAVAREGGGTPPRQQGDDEDEDDEDDEDDEPYTMEEVETVEACLRSMECSTQALKLALAAMTHVADLVTPSTSSSSTSVAESEREACDAWVAELYGLARRTEDNVTDLGAELYAPFDMQKVAEYHAALGATLEELTATLRRPAFASRLSPQLVAELGGLDILRLALSLSAVL